MQKEQSHNRVWVMAPQKTQTQKKSEALGGEHKLLGTKIGILHL